MRRLLIRPGAIGDCITAFPALEYLAVEYTEVWIPSAIMPLVGFADRVRPLSSTGIDLVAVGDLKMPEQLASELRSFDSIVSWYGANRQEFRDEMGGLGIPCEFHRALPPGEYRGHAADFFASQVGAPLGLHPRLRMAEHAARESVAIHPFSGSAKKNWPLEHFRELAARLSCPVEWTAGPEEELDSAVRFSNLGELAGWIAGARLYIGNDSGIAHLAAAAGVPVLVLFGPSAAEIWAPRGRDVTILAAQPLERLSVETVLRAANRLLDCR
jgi:heptosyltransferase III